MRTRTYSAVNIIRRCQCHRWLAGWPLLSLYVSFVAFYFFFFSFLVVCCCVVLAPSWCCCVVLPPSCVLPPSWCCCVVLPPSCVLPPSWLNRAHSNTIRSEASHCARSYLRSSSFIELHAPVREHILSSITIINIMRRFLRPMTARVPGKSLTSCNRILLFLHRGQAARWPHHPFLLSLEYPCTCPCRLNCMQRLLPAPWAAFTALGQLFALKTATHPGTV
jgi:hypothetical protein